MQRFDVNANVKLYRIYGNVFLYDNARVTITRRINHVL